VGPATSAKLHLLGITTVREVADLTEADLVSMLGRAVGRQLHALAHNRDPRRVRPRSRRRSIGAQHALGRRPTSWQRIEANLAALVERVTRRMRAAGRAGRTVVLRLRFDDFTRVTRSHTMPYPTAQTQAILLAARTLLLTARPMIERRGLTLVGVAVTNLDDGSALQLELPFDRRNRDALDAALDQVRDRYGSAAVIRAASLGRDRRSPPPLLPD
jgi:DNA polymerase-4